MPEVAALRRPATVFESRLLDGRGTVHRFELVFEPGLVSAFAFRSRGVARAYVNACPHFGVPLDGRGGELFDRARRHLVCGTHGALFKREDGVCVQGPCMGDRLDALEIVEVFGACQVFVPAALERDLVARLSVKTPVA